MTFKTKAFAALAFALPQAATAACNGIHESFISDMYEERLITQSVAEELMEEAECSLDMVEMVDYITTGDHILAFNMANGMLSYKHKGALTMTCLLGKLVYVVDAKGKDHC